MTLMFACAVVLAVVVVVVVDVGGVMTSLLLLLFLAEMILFGLMICFWHLRLPFLAADFVLGDFGELANCLMCVWFGLLLLFLVRCSNQYDVVSSFLLACGSSYSCSLMLMLLLFLLFLFLLFLLLVVVLVACKWRGGRGGGSSGACNKELQKLQGMWRQMQLASQG